MRRELKDCLFILEATNHSLAESHEERIESERLPRVHPPSGRANLMRRELKVVLKRAIESERKERESHEERIER